MGPKGPPAGAEGCNLPQELERPAKRATFLVFNKNENYFSPNMTEIITNAIQYVNFLKPFVLSFLVHISKAMSCYMVTFDFSRNSNQYIEY